MIPLIVLPAEMINWGDTTPFYVSIDRFLLCYGFLFLVRHLAGPLYRDETKEFCYLRPQEKGCLIYRVNVKISLLTLWDAYFAMSNPLDALLGVARFVSLGCSPLPRG
ncbi:hypothetical protein CEXT_593271 [Caerostris extrusa]|uniref:Uncharacterized protein n=1 Tax=Caerostris extrusa TaxID=172846 RepID=A0AAV4T384_CAEEX|nr:hypothetical protein CEXT_593271 [Caerostris extrusa]